ncbi:MAG: hypothetical protein F2814_03915 [Actinobacteria bacterium]|nr:hypothetical protein [Actinomycetota bacterium]
MRISQKTLLALISCTAIAVTLSACGSGPDAPTRLISKVTDGAEGSIKENGNDIQIRNLLLVAQEDGSAVLVGSIINQVEREDALLGIGITGVAATITGNTSLPLEKPIIFEGDAANAKAVFTGLNAKAGTNVAISLFFARAGEITLNVIVRDKRDTYAGVSS